MQKFSCYIIFTALLCMPFCAPAQNKSIDSLKALLKKKTDHFTRFKIYLGLGNEFRYINIDSASDYHEKAHVIAKINLSETYKLDAENELAYDQLRKNETDAGYKTLKKINTRLQALIHKKRDATKDLQELLASNYEYLGRALRRKDSLVKAIGCFEKSLEISIKQKNLELQSTLYDDLAQTFYMQGSYPRSLDYCLKGLRINEKRGNKEGIAKNTGNAGILFKEMNDHEKALVYFKKALKLNQDLNDKRSIAINLGNIGVAYKHLKQDSLAFDYYQQAAKIHEELGDKEGLIYNYNNIGLSYHQKKDYAKAMEYFEKSLKLAKEVDDSYTTSHTNIYMAESYIEMKKFSEAKKCLDIAFGICMRIGAIELITEYYQARSALNEKSGNHLAALADYKNYIRYKDSLLNDEKFRAAIHTESKLEYEKKMLEDSIIYAKEKALRNVQLKRKNAELRADRNLQLGLYGGLALMLLFAVFLYNRFKITARQKNIIQQQKLIVEQKQREAETQKDLVEEKQREIIASINYAKRIQYTLLAHDHVLKKNMGEFFIMYKPKDIVSGDFYWAVEKNVNTNQKEFYLALCDSTGHGVPGAFMALLNTSFLNEAINEKNMREPGNIFNYIRTRLVESVSHEGAQDGMDAILIKLNGEASVVQYAASNNQPILVRNGNLMPLDYDKMPIGKSDHVGSFKSHTVNVQKGDMLYLYTDGYSDQFGGDKGRKYKEATLRDLLVKISSKPVTEQKIILEEEFETYKGNFEQIDDVCFIGIRI